MYTEFISINREICTCIHERNKYGILQRFRKLSKLYEIQDVKIRKLSPFGTGNECRSRSDTKLNSIFSQDGVWKVILRYIIAIDLNVDLHHYHIQLIK